MKSRVLCALLALVLASCFVMHTDADASIPIFVRSCSMCRRYGSLSSCTSVSRTYVQCNGLFLENQYQCKKRAGLFLTSPKEGCYMM